MQNYWEVMDNLVEQIRSDSLSGAEELARKSADVIRKASKLDEWIDAGTLLDRLVDVSGRLIQAKPAMASIFNLANAVVSSVDGIKDSRLIRTEVIRVIDGRNATSRQHVRTIASHASVLIQNQSVVLTHSFSSTVLAALLSAQRSSIDFTLICSESLPMGEGRMLGRELAQAGIAVRIVSDSEIAGVVQHANIVFLGGDAVCDVGLVNKVGSREIATAAHRLNVPCYALCTTYKLAPHVYRYSREEFSEPGATIEGTYDLTPMDILTAIVTENGVCSTGQIKVEIALVKVHSRLL